MSHYQCDVSISASAPVVFAALTTPEGLRGWWTATCDVGSGVGRLSTFRFGQTYKVMQIESLQPNTEVRWKCIDGHIHSPGRLTKTNEWIGTTMVFRLEPRSPSGTLLYFEHVGLTPQIQCYDICTQGWGHFLGSLRQYAETGTGTPYVETPQRR